MEKLFFMQPILDLISKGKFFRTGFAWVLRILAVVVLLGGFYLFIEAWRIVRYLHFFGIIGFLISQALLLVAIWIIAQIILNRSNLIIDLKDAHFTIIPIFSIILKMWGEIYATLLLLLSVVSTILIWSTGGEIRGLYYQFREFAPFLQTGQGFWSGFLSLGIGIVTAFISLFLFYLLSELLVVTFDIANNVKEMAQIDKKQAIS